MTKKNIGSERLFDHYILMMIEKSVLSYKVGHYCRMVQTMADRGFVDDFIFWDKYAFRYVFEDPKAVGGKRQLHPSEAKRIWDSYVYLRIKCPTLDVKQVLQQLEKFMDNKLL